MLHHFCHICFTHYHLDLDWHWLNKESLISHTWTQKWKWRAVESQPIQTTFLSTFCHIICCFIFHTHKAAFVSRWITWNATHTKCRVPEKVPHLLLWWDCIQCVLLPPSWYPTIPLHNDKAIFTHRWQQLVSSEQAVTRRWFKRVRNDLSVIGIKPVSYHVSITLCHLKWGESSLVALYHTVPATIINLTHHLPLLHNHLHLQSLSATLSFFCVIFKDCVFNINCGTN